MTCYHPLKAFKVGTTKNGKDDLKVVPYSVDHLELVELNGKRSIIKDYEPVDWSFCPPGHIKYFTDFVEIPCGKCIGCRLDYSRQWANRLMLENAYHTVSYFVTLTYDNYYLEKNCKRLKYAVDGEDPIVSYSLVKRDFQLFMKRLRKHFKDADIRYYACGEYGSKTKRPHYHAILFGVPFDDLVYYKRNFEGDSYFVSETLAKLWPYGFHLIANVTWNTCAYVSRYVTKKLNGSEKDFYSTFNIDPEFSTMSLKPGIGRSFFDEFKHDIYSGDNLIRLKVPGDPVSFSPPRYFDKLYDLERPADLVRFKDIRKARAESKDALESSNTSLPKLQYLSVKEDSHVRRTGSLKRGDC